MNITAEKFRQVCLFTEDALREDFPEHAKEASEGYRKNLHGLLSERELVKEYPITEDDLMEAFKKMTAQGKYEAEIGCFIYPALALMRAVRDLRLPGDEWEEHAKQLWNRIFREVTEE